MEQAARVTLVAVCAVLAWATTATAQRQPEFAIVGQVVDETGAVLPRATVDLIGPDGTLMQSVASDATGNFRMESVVSGRYELRVSFAGFRTSSVRVTVSTRAPAALRVTLALAGVTQNIVVTSSGAEVSAESASNADAVTLGADVIQSLPVFDGNVLGTVLPFLDTGAIGTSGVTLIVNGMEVNSLNVSASAIQQIKINADPYSAEYGRPGRGRIEILTKPGGQTFHGELNTTFRDAALDAQNAFAATRPSEERRIFEGSFGGPVGGGGTRSFMISAQEDSDDQQLFVFARGLSGEIRDAAPVANRHRLVSGSITFQVGDQTTISIRPSYEYTSNPNRGVGGTTLATAGWTYEHTEDDLTYLQQTIINQALVNQFQILFGYENEPTISASSAAGIVVDGAFKGGGAQNTLLRTERHVQASESLTWTRGHNLVQVGFQVPDWSWRAFDDRTNSGGTFYFSDLQAYAAGQPYALVLQQGNGKVNWLEKVVATYVKDDWTPRPGVTLSLGVRYDLANYFSDHDNLAPRFSAAYALGKGDVIRGGGGVFYDKVGPFPVLSVLQTQPGGLRRMVVTNPSYPDPFPNGDLQLAPPSITEFAPGIQTPYTFQYSAGIEHQMLKGATVAITYTGARGSLFRSTDINAPLPPEYDVRPNPTYGQIRQIESSGRQQSDALQVMLRGTVTRWFNGQMQYTLSRVNNDTDGLAYFSSNDYNLSGEWGRASFDRRHRFVLLGRVRPGRVLDLGVGLNLQSGAPYTETLPGDPFNNGRGNARPAGIERNSLQGAGTASLDLRASRDVTFAKGTPQARTITVALDAFNLLNRVNYTTYVGTTGSPLFGQPVAARAPRQLQLSFRVKF